MSVCRVGGVYSECWVNILCASLCVLVCIKLKNEKVRDYIVNYIKSLTVYKAAVALLPGASPSLGLWMEQEEVNHAKLSSHLPNLIYIYFLVKKTKKHSCKIVPIALAVQSWWISTLVLFKTAAHHKCLWQITCQETTVALKGGGAEREKETDKETLSFWCHQYANIVYWWHQDPIKVSQHHYI